MKPPCAADDVVRLGADRLFHYPNQVLPYATGVAATGPLVYPPTLWLDGPSKVLGCTCAVTPRLFARYIVGIYSPQYLPSAVQEMLATRNPPLQQYEALSKAWHRIGRITVPDYAPYLRHLVRTREVGRRSALDVACGTGMTASVLSEEFERVHAVDLSPHMLAAAKTELRTHSNIERAAATAARSRVAGVTFTVVARGSHTRPSGGGEVGLEEWGFPRSSREATLGR